MHRLALSIVLSSAIAVSALAQAPRKVGADTVTDGTNGDIFLSSSPSPYTTSGVFIRANGTTYPNVSAKLGDSTTSTFTVTNSSDTVLLRVKADGSVGIGEASPETALHVTSNLNTPTGIRINNPNSGTSASTSLWFTEGSTVKASIGALSSNYPFVPNGFVIWNSATSPMLIGNAGAEAIRIDTSRRVGIGTSLPTTVLEIASSATSGRGLTVTQFSTDAVSPLISARKARGTNTARTAVTNGDALTEIAALGHDGTDFVTTSRIRFGVDGTVGTNNVPTAIQFFTGANGAGNERLRIASNGNVGINEANPTEKLVVNGNLAVTGSITGATVIHAVYQDLAEWVPATTPMEPGTVVVLNRTQRNEVMPSARPYDTAVAGVVSAQPGLILGLPSDTKAQVATTGRVKVRVDASMGAIAVGDLLVTSDKPGTAMKS